MTRHRQRSRSNLDAAVIDPSGSTTEDPQLTDSVATGETPVADGIRVKWREAAPESERTSFGKRQYPNPSLEWPVEQMDVLDDDLELELAPDPYGDAGARYQIESVHVTKNRWGKTSAVDVEIIKS